jgi:hypothetical protein
MSAKKKPSGGWCKVRGATIKFIIPAWSVEK